MKEMTNFKKAHEMTREIKKQYEDVDYKAQFVICLQFLAEGGETMIELKGSEKQIKWAEEIRTKRIAQFEEKKEIYKEKLKNVSELAKNEKHLAILTKRNKLYISKMEKVLDKMQNKISSSKFYIETRNELIKDFLKIIEAK